MGPDSKKVEALGRIATPGTIHEVRAVLGFINCYQQYVPEFAKLMEPCYALLRGHPNRKAYNKRPYVEWTQEWQVGLERAVRLLKNAVLYLPVDGDRFLVETDASDATVGESCL